MFTKFVLALSLVFSSPSVSAQNIISPDVIENHSGAYKNYVKNPSGYKNANNVTTSSASIARDTDAADKLDGISSLICDASSQNGYCEWDSKTIQEGDKTGNCEAKALFKGDASLYKLQIHDGSSVLASSAVLSNATDWTPVSVNYPCGTTRKVRLTQTESGTGAAVNIGRVYWGKETNLGLQNPISDPVSYTPTFAGFGTVTNIEAHYIRVGKMLHGWGYATSTTPTAAVGNIGLPSGLTIDSSVVTKKYAGRYVTSISGAISQKDFDLLMLAGNSYVETSMVEYTPAVSALTAQNVDTLHSSANISWDFWVPISGWGSQPVVNDNLTPWYVDATMEGANPSLGITAITSYTEIIDAGLTLKPQSGTAPVGVMCSSTNAATAPSTSNTTCAAGSESVGINFSIPKAGLYEVCFYGAHFAQMDTSEAIRSTFQIIETPTNAQTLTLEGGSRQISGLSNTATATDMFIEHPLSSCSVFNWSSNGIKGVRLMYEQSVTGTPDSSNLIMDADANKGQPNGRWTVFPVTAQSPQPLLTGSVTSNSSGLERIERLNVGDGTVCSASPCTISSQSGSWVTSVTRGATGDYTVNIATGIFSAKPACSATTLGSSAPGELRVETSSATSLNIKSCNSGCSGALDNTFSILCMGPR
ncbi:MAG: hypothetical protein E6R04_09695 [Spirochaetes bacterium]|nr:MAG: hypothetical protein E6R04_09695 [Spirochaetota bacterium]